MHRKTRSPAKARATSNGRQMDRHIGRTPPSPLLTPPPPLLPLPLPLLLPLLPLTPLEWDSRYQEEYRQAEFQCSYSLQLLLGNQQQSLTVHFHVSPFALPLGRVLVLLQLVTTMDSNLVYITGSPRSKKRKEKGKRACRGESPREKVAHPEEH